MTPAVAPPPMRTPMPTPIAMPADTPADTPANTPAVPEGPVAPTAPSADAVSIDAPIARPTAPRAPAAAPPHRPNGNGMGMHPPSEHDDSSVERGATAPQLRRFIKSRAYVPMHELRRRFAINSADDDVTPVDLERRRVFVGLPEREGRLLGELLRGGDIGFELSLDPITPIVVGVYPMRPVTRT
jgi:hypothetical protein